MNFLEGISQVCEREATDGRSHLENGRGPAKSENRQEKKRDKNAELKGHPSKTIHLA
jgi:hypothetical protein